MRKLKPSKYIPSGPNANVALPIVRNAKISSNVGMMHDKWLSEQFPSRVRKKDPEHLSISSLKIVHRCRRAVARTIQAQLLGGINDSNKSSV